MWRHGTVAVVLMVLGPIGVGSALVVLVRLRGQLERLGEQVDRVARRVESLPPNTPLSSHNPAAVPGQDARQS